MTSTARRTRNPKRPGRRPAVIRKRRAVGKDVELRSMLGRARYITMLWSPADGVLRKMAITADQALHIIDDKEINVRLDEQTLHLKIYWSAPR